jgi:hypothetical protein
MRYFFPLLLLGLILATSPAHAQTVFTYTDGPGGNIQSGDDTTIKYWGDGNQNGGGHGSFAPGLNENSLLRFNLSAIPASANCVNAQLYLYHDSNAEGAPNPATGNVYSLTQTNGDWVAGTKNISGVANVGETTWNRKAYQVADWASHTAGAESAGSDYETPAIGSYSANPQAAIGTQTVIDLACTRVKGWFGSPNTNYGIIIIGNNNSEIHWGQGQENNTVAAYRPKLVVTYSTGGTPNTPDYRDFLSFLKNFTNIFDFNTLVKTIF